MRYVFFHPQKAVWHYSRSCASTSTVYIFVFLHERSSISITEVNFAVTSELFDYDARSKSFFAALALHLHHIRTVIVYTCIISYVTISMFKIGFSQKGWTFSPRVVPDFFRHGSFCFGQFLIWEALQMTVIRPPWRNDYAIASQIRKRTYWLRISCCWLS